MGTEITGSPDVLVPVMVMGRLAIFCSSTWKSFEAGGFGNTVLTVSGDFNAPSNPISRGIVPGISCEGSSAFTNPGLEQSISRMPTLGSIGCGCNNFTRDSKSSFSPVVKLHSKYTGRMTFAPLLSQEGIWAWVAEVSWFRPPSLPVSNAGTTKAV